MTAKDPRTGRGPLRRLRGWGGVSAMAAACAVTASLTLLPLSHDGDDVFGPQATGPGALNALQTRADSCKDPLASVPPSEVDGEAVRRIKERGKLIAGVDQNSFQWGFRDPETGKLEGFDIDLVRAIAKAVLGDENKVIFRAIPTNQRIEALENDKVDVVVRTMTINCARLRDVSFSTPYFLAGQQVLAAKEDHSITGYNSTLAGKRICTAEGSTAYDELKKKSYGAVFEDEHDGTPADEDQLTVPNQLDCLVRLQLGEVDAIVTDNALAAGQAAQDPAVQLKGTPFTEEYYGVATKLGADDLVARVNKVLLDYTSGGADSPWMTSYKKWLANGLPGIEGPPKPQ
ncbi:glutamate ABC transporter substrate-binding protein [Streptomyces sp. NPDC006976]|uniref:glutamate ABC transporter substrate-binding protein n=1 Tax=unclassified Streptomyces TaxID=2593676 RepID=UPI000365A8FC|nr:MULTISPECIES: glutamate ABC transporter substrate-binding protein [unclassified Streptomyces]